MPNGSNAIIGRNAVTKTGMASVAHHIAIHNPIAATRYHSLVVERESLPDCFEVTAECDEGLIMGLQHKELPIHGVQFHPESIATEHGHALLANFLKVVGYETVPA